MRFPGGLDVEIIAHRGYGRPENTLHAFRAAWALGVDAFELDFHQSADGELIVIHDFTTSELSGGRTDWKVRERTLAEIRGLAATETETPPTLREVLDSMPPAMRLYAEAKPGPELAAALAETVTASGRPTADFKVISFNVDTVRAVRRALPRHEVYQIVEFVESDGRWEARYLAGPGEGAERSTRDFTQLLREAREEGLAGFDTSTRVPPGFASQVLAAGLRWVVWTVNDGELARSLARRGAHGLTTDDPPAIRSALESRREAR